MIDRLTAVLVLGTTLVVGGVRYSIFPPSAERSAEPPPSISLLENGTPQVAQPLAEFPRPSLDNIRTAWSYERAPLLAQYVDTATTAELRLLFEWLLSEAPDELGKAKAVWVRWLEIDPVEAIEAAASAGEGIGLARHCVAAWEEMNPHAVANFLREYPTQASSHPLIGIYAKHFPKEAAESFLAKLAHDPTQYIYLEVQVTRVRS